MARSPTKSELEERAKGPKFVSRRLVAAWILHKDPSTTDAQLNKALSALAADEDRHALRDASYYRKLWRKGLLPPAPPEDPRVW